MNCFLFNFFKGLLLLRTPFEIVLLGHLIERAYNQTVIWDVHPSKTHNT